MTKSDEFRHFWRLTRDERHAIWSVDLLSYTEAETARRMNLRVRTVAALRRSGKAKLRSFA